MNWFKGLDKNVRVGIGIGFIALGVLFAIIASVSKQTFLILFFILFVVFGIVALIISNKVDKEKTAQAAEESRQKQLEETNRYAMERQAYYSANGLPTVNADVNLQKNEVCHFQTESASSCKIKSRVAGYQGGSRGVSFRVMKGVSFRVGNYKGSNIREEYIDRTYGKLFLTSKRLVFSAPKNAASFSLDKILTVDTHEGLIQIQTNNDKNYLFDMDGKIDFLIILDMLLKATKESSKTEIE